MGSNREKLAHFVRENRQESMVQVFPRETYFVALRLRQKFDAKRPDITSPASNEAAVLVLSRSNGQKFIYPSRSRCALPKSHEPDT
jgi:hypothetical protein